MKLNDGRVVPAFLDQALQDQPITIFGDGSQTRSFCYVSDLVDGLYRLMLSDEVMPVNLGNPCEMTILEFATTIIELTGSKSSLIRQPLPEDDPKQRRPDISKARRVLKWEPKVTLEEGLRPTIEYFQGESLPQPVVPKKTPRAVVARQGRFPVTARGYCGRFDFLALFFEQLFRLSLILLPSRPITFTRIWSSSFQFVANFLDAIFGDFADVQQAVGAGEDFDESAEVDDPNNLAEIGLDDFSRGREVADDLQRLCSRPPDRSMPREWCHRPQRQS